MVDEIATDQIDEAVGLLAALAAERGNEIDRRQMRQLMTFRARKYLADREVEERYWKWEPVKDELGKIAAAARRLAAALCAAGRPTIMVLQGQHPAFIPADDPEERSALWSVQWDLMQPEQRADWESQVRMRERDAGAIAPAVAPDPPPARQPGWKLCRWNGRPPVHAWLQDPPSHPEEFLELHRRLEMLARSAERQREGVNPKGFRERLPKAGDELAMWIARHLQKIGRTDLVTKTKNGPFRQLCDCVLSAALGGAEVGDSIVDSIDRVVDRFKAGGP